MKIVMFSVSTISLLFLPFSAFSEENISPEQRPCFDLIEGWYAGDASKLDPIMHPSFIKKGVLKSPSTGETVTASHDKTEFIAAVAAPRDLYPESEWDISVKTVHLAGTIATVEVISRDLIDVCQLGKINGDWQIMNVIWTIRKD